MSDRRERMERIGSSDIVEEWPCRSCGRPVSVVESSIEIMGLFNAMLAKRGEARLDENEVMICLGCRDKRNAAAELANEEKRGRVRKAIQLLKEGGDAPYEREAMLLLEHEYGPGESAAMIRAYATRKEKRAERERKRKTKDTAPSSPPPAPAPPPVPTQGDLLELHPTPTRPGHPL